MPKNFPIDVAPSLRALRQHAGSYVIEYSLRSLSALAQLVPWSRRALQEIAVTRNISYGPHAKQRLDIHSPPSTASPPPNGLPVVVYIHGGGFRILSKDTHWMMALSFARAGYLVVNINYRLAPKDAFPKGLEDAAAALQWTAQHIRAFGGDPTRIILAGESAGANLATCLAFACSAKRPERFATELFEAGIRPIAVVPFCGMLEVRNIRRFAGLPFNAIIFDRLERVSRGYTETATAIPFAALDPESQAIADVSDGLDFIDPLLMIEQVEQVDRPLPPCFPSVGTRDVLLGDSQRLKSSWERLGGHAELLEVQGEPHGFQAAIFRSGAKLAWDFTLDRLAKLLDSPARSANSSGSGL